jgi:hypothetical protein
VQDPNVLQVRLICSFGQQCIVGASELQRREQRFSEHVAAEGTGFAHQRVDDVPVVDPMRIASDQPLHERDALAFIVQFDDISVQAHSQLAADQSRGHRV